MSVRERKGIPFLENGGVGIWYRGVGKMPVGEVRAVVGNGWSGATPAMRWRTGLRVHGPSSTRCWRQGIDW